MIAFKLEKPKDGNDHWQKYKSIFLLKNGYNACSSMRKKLKEYQEMDHCWSFIFHCYMFFRNRWWIANEMWSKVLGSFCCNWTKGEGAKVKDEEDENSEYIYH